MTFRDNVRAIQRRLGVAEDGLIGPLTIAAIIQKLDRLAVLEGDNLAPSTSASLKVSQAGIDLIHSFEQCRLEAYPDPGSADGNPWTIGWGSTGPGIAKGVRWTQEQADKRFADDLAKFAAGVEKALAGTPTTQAQFDAMVSLAYNIGADAFASSTVARKHKVGDYEGAATAFGMWIKNDGKVMEGLRRRRAVEAKHYLGQSI